MRSYKTVKQKSETEIVIKHSRFIGRCFPVQSEGEALALLNEIRKTNWDATHNCFAYRIGETGGAARFSDDGEPGGTAGKPIVDVLSAKELVDTLIVVTRYFGGILLGAGGLVRAYSQSAAQACSEAGLIEMRAGKKLEIKTDYSRYGALETLLRERAQIIETEFGAEVLIKAMAAQEEAEAIIAALVDKSGGRCDARIAGEGYIETPL